MIQVIFGTVTAVQKDLQKHMPGLMQYSPTLWYHSRETGALTYDIGELTFVFLWFLSILMQNEGD